MVRSDVVEYLRENLPKFPVEALRRQLYEEGVSDIDFEHCLAEALRGPKTAPPAKRTAKGGRAAKILLAAGIALIVGGALIALSTQKPSPPAGDAATAGGADGSGAAPAPGAAPSSSGESGYVSPRGWVVRLPKDYVGVSEYKDEARTDELVHFCKRGTDPTSFLDPGLFAQLGIVRLEVMPSPFPANPTGLSNLSTAVSRKITGRGEKFALKTIQIGTLPGVQVNVLAPFPRVEAYVLGQSELYFFSGGQEDDVWRDIVLSLRDAHSEN